MTAAAVTPAGIYCLTDSCSIINLPHMFDCPVESVFFFGLKQYLITNKHNILFQKLVKVQTCKLECRKMKRKNKERAKKKSTDMYEYI